MEMVNIVGAGLAGLSAAITLAEMGVKCRLISAQPSERAQSVLAEGGINAALDTMGEKDSPEAHYDDTMRGGCELADPNAVFGLTSHAPEIVEWLVRLGAPLEKRGEKLRLRAFGGQGKKRTAYAKSSTGKIIMSALIDEARRHEAAGMILRLPHHLATDVGLIEKNGEMRCTGVQILDRYTDETAFLSGSVILAVGGLNGLFPEKTTGSVQNTGDLIAALFQKGLAIANPEFIQYHPTTASIAGKRLLISEAARSEGGRLFVMKNGKPCYFMEELYPEFGNLMPRDVVSREIVNAARSAKTDESGENNALGRVFRVFLDMRSIKKEVWLGRMSDMRSEIIDYLAADPMREPIAVEPGIHFFMGGAAVDERHKTNIRSLFAAGECAAQYHGANRLGGNSLLGAIYGGRVAAQTAAEQPDEADAGNGILPETRRKAAEEEKLALCVSGAVSNRIGRSLLHGLGIIRDEACILTALDKLDAIEKGRKLNPAEKNRVALGRAMLFAALARKESRGAHYRSDFPQRDDMNYKKTTLVIQKNGAPEVRFVDISQKRGSEAKWN